MKRPFLQRALLVVLLIVSTCVPGHAWHRHGGVWIVGPRVWVDPYPYYYAPYYYSVPPPVVIQQQPDLYIQQQPPPEQKYWYYCPSPQGYYPYIKECPSGWMKVVPTPPADQPGK